ncbi:HEPN domain-containing protein [Paracoccus aestuarii]|uniref:HEPN domain-containing protein n=1 Tax=Paracoccus aestuarii TaxID=453842 RepID=UPI0011C40CA1|nr:HEPN domain-containing protein [Paracoccus aestuarii]WCQ98567.1 hypothetical protein JHW48_11775 [Paracoccus aestuarii]
MSEARSQLIRRLAALELGLSSETIAQKSPAEVEHNQVAALFRQGMAVVAFVALEDFVKRRASEALDKIGHCGIPFVELPDKLKKATTYEAFGSIAFQLKIRSPEEKEVYAQESAGAIFSTASESYNLYRHAFGFDASNIGSESVNRFLSAVGVSSAWQNMTALAGQLDLGLDLKGRFESSARLRHKAAHVPSANITVGELETLRKNCIAISICFDALLETALCAFERRDHDILSGRRPLTSADVMFCKVKWIDDRWKVYPKGAVRALRAFPDKPSAEQFVLQKAWGSRCCAIFYGEDRFASAWKIIR